MKILILLVYYNRPKMVRYALESIRRAGAQHADFEVAFIDDGSDYPGAPVVMDVLKDHQDKIRFYDISYPEPKRTYTIHGQYMNQAIQDSSAEVSFVLCDDDAITDEYLARINAFYTAHPKIMSAYCHIQLFNPFKEKPWDLKPGQNLHGGQYTQPMNCSGTMVASCCLSWRTEVNMREDVWWVERREQFTGQNSPDVIFARDLFKKAGPSHFIGCVGQYRGVHPVQLTLSQRRGKGRWGGAIDLP